MLAKVDARAVARALCGLVTGVMVATAWASLANAASLPDGRGYELVSPTDKNGGDVVADSTRTHAAVDGGAVIFSSLVGFGQVEGTGVQAEYMAVREGAPGTSGWVTHGITPRQEAMSGQGTAFELGNGFQGDFAPDLSRGIYRAFLPLADEGNASAVPNLYLSNDLRTAGAGVHTLLTGASGPVVAPFGREAKPFLVGSSDDFGNTAFESILNLTTNAPPQDFFCAFFASFCEPRLYEASGGAVRLVGVLPDGTPASGSSGGLGATLNNRYTPRTVSADGSRIFFQADPRVANVPYVRVNGRTSVQLNLSERTTPESAQSAQFWSASADGSRAFFITGEGLVDADATPSSDVYMWERQPDDERQTVTVDATGGTFTLTSRGATTPAIPFNAAAADLEAALEGLTTVGPGNVTVAGGPGGAAPYVVTFTGDFAGTNVPESIADASGLSGGAATATVATTNPVTNLQRISADDDTDNAGAAAIIGSSKDGRWVYFMADNQFIDGEPAPFGAKLYVWHDGAIRYIGALAAGEDFGRDGPHANGGFPRTMSTARVTPDGRHVLFMSSRDAGLRGQGGFPGYDHGTSCTFDVGTGRPCRELYLYSADTGALACASCNPRAAATSDALMMIRVGFGGSLPSLQHLPRHLSDDGRRVFFSTGEALVPEDSNGRYDAYIYDADSGRASLLSSGTEPSDSYFLDASPDGKDAFFVTRARLVGWDVDDNYDLYDARVGGGMPEPVVAPPACVGSACQGSPEPAPAADSSSSALLEGKGDADEQFRPRRRAARRRRACRRGRSLRRVRGRARCVSRRRARRAATRTAGQADERIGRRAK